MRRERDVSSELELNEARSARAVFGRMPLFSGSAPMVAVMLATMFARGVPMAAAGQTNAVLQVSAIVRATTKVQTEYQTTQLTITADDILRGHIEVRDASRFSVQTNSRAGYALYFYPIGDIFESVEIVGLRNHVALGPDGGAAVLRDLAGPSNEHDLSYRFILKPDLEPGNYPWPLMLAVRPL